MARARLTEKSDPCLRFAQCAHARDSFRGMRSCLDPFSFLVVTVAGWLNQRQQQVIEYLIEENRVVREQIGRRRLRFGGNQRRRLYDRDPLYTKEFLGIVAGSGIRAIKLPPRPPNLNAYAERFVRTIKESCLDQMIFSGEDMLRNAIRELVTHYHLERNHQGVENRLLVPLEITSTKTPVVQKRERLGGLLN